MKIGDKVRLLHGIEEGIIRRIINNRTVDVEIDDGFLIPVLITDLVSIAKEEENSFESQSFNIEIEEPKVKPTFKEEDKGIFIGLERKDNQVTIWFVNSSENDLAYTVHKSHKASIKGISRGIINAFDYFKIDDWDLKQQEDWPELLFQILTFYENTREIKSPENSSIKITDKLLRKKAYENVILGKNVILISLTDPMPEIIDAQKIKESLFTEDHVFIPKERQSTIKSSSVDLHIESIHKNSESINKEDILSIQLSEFERQLDLAVMNGVDSVVFIHGVGNGVLRQSIHKKLSKYPHLKYFEDAQKEKFGFGATKVYLK